jgi:predicted MFS family arabinose efflux permease
MFLRLPRLFWLLWVGMLVNRAGGAVFPFMSLYLTRERGMDAATAGMILGIYAGAGMVAGPVGGELADRVGRRATLLLGTSLAAASMVALGLARSLSALVALAALLGFFTELCRPPLQAAVADVVPPEDRARAYGLLFWAINLGFSMAAVLAGAVASHSFTLLFVIDAATTLLFGVLVLGGLPDTRPPGGRGQAGHPLRSMLLPFRDRAVQVFAAIQLPVLLVFQQFTVAYPLDMRARGLSHATIGTLLALNGITIIVVQPLVLRALGGLNRARVLALAAVLVGVGFGIPALGGGVAVYATATLVFTLGEIAFAIAIPSLLADLAPAHHRGSYQGAFQLVFGLAGMAAPAFGSLVLAEAGARALWLGCLAVGLCAAVLHLTATDRWTEQAARARRAA